MLAVSLVTYHTPTEELENCLFSLHSPIVRRIEIIDNSSSERIAAIARRHDIDYTPSQNVGYGAGHNISIRRTLKDKITYHLVLNTDVKFDSKILEEMVDYLDSHPDTVAMHPDLHYPDGSKQFTARLLPTPIDVFGRRFLPDFIFKRRNDRYTLSRYDLSKPVDIPYFQGSFMLLRCETLKSSGLFDERFFMYPEDIDLCRRLHRVGKTLYWPYAEVIHDHHSSSYKSFRMLLIHIVNMIKYFNKWGWWHDSERRRFNRKVIDSLNIS